MTARLLVEWHSPAELVAALEFEDEHDLDGAMFDLAHKSLHARPVHIGPGIGGIDEVARLVPAFRRSMFVQEVSIYIKVGIAKRV